MPHEFPDVFYNTLGRLMAENSLNVRTKFSVAENGAWVIRVTWDGLNGQEVDKLKQELFCLTQKMGTTSVSVNFQWDRVTFYSK